MPRPQATQACSAHGLMLDKKFLTEMYSPVKKFATPTLTPKTAHKLQEIINLNYYDKSVCALKPVWRARPNAHNAS